MARRSSRRGRPAATPEAREQQLVSKAMELADQQLEDGTASAQVITHFLRLGTRREELERVKLEQESYLLEEKVATMASARRIEELYAEALNAMRLYSGDELPEADEEL